MIIQSAFFDGLRTFLEAAAPHLSLLVIRISLCTCEKAAAENGAFGGCFRHPFHHTPTGALTFFEALERQAPREPPTQSVAHVFDIHSHSPSPSPLPQRGLFW